MSYVIRIGFSLLLFDYLTKLDLQIKKLRQITLYTLYEKKYAHAKCIEF